jgi:hypothetical protein
MGGSLKRSLGMVFPNIVHPHPDQQNRDEAATLTQYTTDYVLILLLDVWEELVYFCGGQLCFEIQVIDTKIGVKKNGQVYGTIVRRADETLHHGDAEREAG